ncbi:YkvA family protein [Tsuneonella sp. YG55]|uniref:YkvA family protein n=1 Tax=Tsuneonella litorea TaxID=2976475 RepID=A0A9X3A6T5_9SPHN|nr:YkvA family protein [Tsuneonella litorea]MCT2557671.1 YkvA family protein [Tsuneonella litorea]
MWVAARDPRTPIAAKLLAGAVAAYAFSPIDLIPDFIPVLGLVDDLLIVPAGVWLALKLIPAPLMAEYREAAARLAERPVSRGAAVAIIAAWVAILAIGGWRLLR